MPYYDEYGYPKDRGAVDFQDSARLVGILQVFDHPNKLNEKILDYYSIEKDYLRHPKEENIYKFSRDQWVCLAAGYKAAGYSDQIYGIYEPENGDFMSQSHRSHIKICQGYSPTLLGNLWLWLDVLYSCFIDPLAEPNQLICMLIVHPNKAYLKFWCKWNKHWEASIKNYWCENEGAWRGEHELAEIMIREIKNLTEGIK